MIDSNFVDVDFEAEAIASRRMCGWLPSPPHEQRFAGIYEATNKVYPRSEWKDIIKRKDDLGTWPCRIIRFLHDQNGEPSCVYNAAALAMQLAWNFQFGPSYGAKFSAISGYRHNGTPHSGSTVGGAARWLESVGLQPSQIPDNEWLREHGARLHPDNGYRTDQADGWKHTARMFRIDEWFRVTSVEGWFSAMADGWACVGGRDGHCICHVELAMEGNDLLSIYAQSWGEGWGFTMPIFGREAKSFGADSERKIRTMVARDAWACRTVVVPEFMVTI